MARATPIGWRKWGAALALSTLVHLSLGELLVTDDAPAPHAAISSGTEGGLLATEITLLSSPIEEHGSAVGGPPRADEEPAATSAPRRDARRPGAGSRVRIPGTEARPAAAPIAAVAPGLGAERIGGGIDTSAPASSGGSPGATGQRAAASFAASVRAAINAEKRYPRRARKLGAEGLVVLRLSWSEAGDRAVVNVETRSSHPDLDGEALEMARRAGPFERPPALPIEVEVPIRFRQSDLP